MHACLLAVLAVALVHAQVPVDLANTENALANLVAAQAATSASVSAGVSTMLYSQASVQQAIAGQAGTVAAAVLNPINRNISAMENLVFDIVRAGVNTVPAYVGSIRSELSTRIEFASRSTSKVMTVVSAQSALVSSAIAAASSARAALTTAEVSTRVSMAASASASISSIEAAGNIRAAGEISTVTSAVCCC